MKILFLDIDGVLNHKSWLQNSHSGLTLNREQWTANLDPTCVARLNDIVLRSRCKVVVSSSWRMRWGAFVLNAILRDAGYIGEIYGVTPCLGERSFEIIEWLKSNREVRSFVVLDDLYPCNLLKGRWVRTSVDTGLSCQDVDAVLQKFGRITLG